MLVWWHPPFPSHKCQTHWQVQAEWCMSGICSQDPLIVFQQTTGSLFSHLLQNSEKNCHLRSSYIWSFRDYVGLEKGSHHFKKLLGLICECQITVSYFLAFFANVEVNFTLVRKCFHNKIYLFQISINSVLWDAVVFSAAQKYRYLHRFLFSCVTKKIQCFQCFFFKSCQNLWGFHDPVKAVV